MLYALMPVCYWRDCLYSFSCFGTTQDGGSNPSACCSRSNQLGRFSFIISVCESRRFFMQITERESQKGTQISTSAFPRSLCLSHGLYNPAYTLKIHAWLTGGCSMDILRTIVVILQKVRNHLKCSKKGIDNGY